MAGVIQLVRANPALAPLFVFGGSGIVGGIAYIGHCLTNGPDVTINKSNEVKPWNRIQPHENAKLWSPNKEFWQERKNRSEQNKA
ncbi:NADH dehydrogenase 1 alpha subcomplex subunit 4 ndufa4 [Entomortierella beljakovae]|nr:NADH dehydrogenase 1 alpha subcomplex subunit 4 ndufa4 [Entomortierella beljakovae]